MYGRISDPAIRLYPPAGRRRWLEDNSTRALDLSPSQSAITRWGRGFQPVRGGLDPEDRRFRPWDVGVVHV